MLSQKALHQCCAHTSCTWSMAVAARDMRGIVEGRSFLSSYRHQLKVLYSGYSTGSRFTDTCSSKAAHLPLPLCCYSQSEAFVGQYELIPRWRSQFPTIKHYIEAQLQLGQYVVSQ